MEISVRKNGSICEVTVKEGNAKIVEDVASIMNKCKVEDSQIEAFFSAGFDLTRFNGKSDVETMKMLFESFLNDSEQKQFIKLVSED